MPTVTAGQTFDGSVHEAESVWYDTGRWPSFVDGLERVEQVGPGWPAVGSVVSWQSGPAGRGRVVERVVSHEPLEGQTVETEDDSIRGRQQVAFWPEDGKVAVELTLSYRVKRRSPFTPVVDLLFIRGAFKRSLQATVERFGVELQGARGADVG
jgi:Polyketide cyclase / dehydrase and lipid transport